ncbi:MmyB family transcriptional regulator [Rugosimonospora acidiphila]|uniref:MmyB family transcriptional regulator n=1 Tax=Rugosimonospora acidiphila TaxID=556531 RepID=UPI003CD0C323
MREPGWSRRADGGLAPALLACAADPGALTPSGAEDIAVAGVGVTPPRVRQPSQRGGADRPGARRVVPARAAAGALVPERGGTNALARALFTDFDALPRRRRNLVHFLFLDDGARPHRRSGATPRAAHRRTRLPL